VLLAGANVTAVIISYLRTRAHAAGAAHLRPLTSDL
jgi:hypothetical protein